MNDGQHILVIVFLLILITGHNALYHYSKKEAIVVLFCKHKKIKLWQLYQSIGSL